jgi:ubiquinone/menaquinone biosynthesis C-methylase UbiE
LTEDAVQRFYEQEAEVYDETRFKSSHGTYSDFVQKSAVLELIGECKGKHILEIGSGTGRFTRELAKRGAHVVCVDLSRKMHEQSRLAINDTLIQYFVSSGFNLGFANETFDICLTINMMSHIKNESMIFNEVCRVLKKEGFFVANFPNMSGLYFPIGAIVNLFERSLQVPVYSKWYTVGELARSFKKSRLIPEKRLGRMIFPKKYCPVALFKLLNMIDRWLASPTFSVLYGDLFVKLRQLT